MKQQDTSLLDLFDATQTDSLTSSPLKTEKQRSLNVKKKKIELPGYNYLEEDKSKNMEQILSSNKMEIPTGVFNGSLPENIIINNEKWICTATGTVNELTYDRIKNTITNEVKTVERKKLLNFLNNQLLIKK